MSDEPRRSRPPPSLGADGPRSPGGLVGAPASLWHTGIVLRLAMFLVTLLAATGCSRSHRVGDEVMVEWEGKEYPAVILSADATKYKVHFKDLDDLWDQDVLKSRVKGFAQGGE